MMKRDFFALVVLALVVGPSIGLFPMLFGQGYSLGMGLGGFLAALIGIVVGTIGTRLLGP